MTTVRAPECPPDLLCYRRSNGDAGKLITWQEDVAEWSREAWARCGPADAPTTP